jgi:hypothetical protein
VLHVLVELAQGVPVGVYGEPVGVRDPYARSAGRVLGQGVDASRWVAAEPPERGDVLKKQTPSVLAAGLESDEGVAGAVGDAVALLESVLRQAPATGAKSGCLSRCSRDADSTSMPPNNKRPLWR